MEAVGANLWKGGVHSLRQSYCELQDFLSSAEEARIALSSAEEEAYEKTLFDS